MSVEKESLVPEINQQTMIQYLLGELPPTWQEHFEERFFTDKACLEQLKVVEDQLVDDYVHDVLAASQRERFESHYLNSDRRRQKVQFARTLKQTIAEVVPLAEKQPHPSFWQSVRIAWQTPAIRYSFAALVILGVLAGCWLIKSALQLQKQRQDLEAERAALTQSPATKATETARPGETSQTSPPLRSSPSEAPLPKPTPNGSAAHTILSITLPPGSFRDEAATKDTPVVTPQTKVIQLKLVLKNQANYATYRIVIETAAGQIVLTRSDLRLVKIGPDHLLVLEFPARSLPANDYLVTLSGKKGKAYEEVDDYQFRIVRQS